MKKFIIKSSLTVVFPIILFLVFYEITMRNIPNDYSHMRGIMEEKVGKIKILVIGNSHCYYGFNSAYFDKPALNISHVSQTYNYDWFLFDKYIDRMDSLEFIILPISSNSPFDKLENGLEFWRCKEYAIRYDCDFHQWYEIKYQYYFAYFSLDNLKQVISRLSDNTYNNIYLDSNGYKRKTLSDRVDNISEEGLIAAARHTIPNMDKKSDLYNENLEYVKDIIFRCQKRGIRIIFVSTPTHPVYYTHLNPEQVKIIENFGRTLEQYDNVKYINLLKSPLFDTNDFFNSDHLCDNGAKKLTLLINNIINEWDNNPIKH